MNYAPAPYYDPQAAYRYPAQSSSFDPSGHHPKVRIWFLVSALVSGGLYFLGLAGIGVAIAIDDHDLSPILGISGWGLLVLGGLLIYLKLGLGLYWVHQAWKWVPVDQRYDKSGKRWGPDSAFMLLIPYYNLYLMFVLNMGLCDAMERMRFAARTPTAGPRDTAMWACIAELIPLGNFFVAPFLWASYMRRVDVMHEEIASTVTPA